MSILDELIRTVEELRESNTKNRIYKFNKKATESVSRATECINRQREACGKALRVFDEQKMFVLNSSVSSFLNAFSRIKKGMVIGLSYLEVGLSAL